ncbi:peptidoglycan-binding protein [Streptomyces bicolor]|uniref:peptidoglycan-binding protein n=1 Tax=Streptomyces bicolor TaxID=66874 RepID=UPI000AD1C617|nr:peptidoglycan-binding protein [Streptomyces bicolor]
MTAPDETREREHGTDPEASVPHPPGDDTSGPPGAAGNGGAPDPSAELELRKPGEVSPPGTGDLETRTTAAPDVATRPGTDVDTATTQTAPDGAGGDEASAPAASRRRRPWRTAGLVALAIAVVAGAGAASAGVLGGDGSGADVSAPDAPPSTTEVKRTTLTRNETVDGSLGHGDVSAVQAPSGQQGGSGVVTWVPADGDVIKRGDAVYRVAEQEVPLLYGSIPLYRQMQEGSEGADVRMLEKNLAALGYTGFDVDDEYTSGTADAVRDWQDDLGREETGTVRPGDAVIAEGARRVADVKALPGAPLGGTVLTWTGTERVVSVDLDAQYEDLVRKGTKATVTLPDDTTVQAEVTDIGTPTTGQDGAPSGAGSDDGGDSDKATLPVELKVADQKKLGSYQAAAVDVSLKAETRENVLVVPINALVARQGGGYAVDVVEPDGEVRRTPVEVGMFADSMVEISGKGLADGTVVGVPK